MSIHFHGLPTGTVDILRNSPDAYGLPPERHTSDGDGIPCRHCLKMVPIGAPYLTVAHRPFEGLNPYTETGPIFLCAAPCEAATPNDALPEILASPTYILRGYSADERILYGTGQVIARAEIQTRAAELLRRPEIAFVDIRSAANNCYQCRVTRA
ncbi:MAG: DUF1203 domain-containing protein [Shimia sp.]